MAPADSWGSPSSRYLPISVSSSLNLPNRSQQNPKVPNAMHLPEDWCTAGAYQTVLSSSACCQSLASSWVTKAVVRPGPPAPPVPSCSPFSSSCSAWSPHFLSLETPYSSLPPQSCPRSVPNVDCVPLCPSAQPPLVTVHPGVSGYTSDTCRL